MGNITGTKSKEAIIEDASLIFILMNQLLLALRFYGFFLKFSKDLFEVLLLALFSRYLCICTPVQKYVVFHKKKNYKKSKKILCIVGYPRKSRRNRLYTWMSHSINWRLQDESLKKIKNFSILMFNWNLLSKQRT